MSPSIKYYGSLISNDTILIDDINLIEFGKYFAHIVNHYFNLKILIEESKIIEAEGENDEEELKTVNKNITSKPNAVNFKKSDNSFNSFRQSRRESKLNSTHLNEALPSISISAIRK